MRDEKGRFTKGNIPWSKGKKCPQLSKVLKGRKFSKEHKKNISKGLKNYLKDNFNNRWKGGRAKTGGYIEILKPDHPFANKNGYIYEHRFVMEQHIGRYLKPTERIHHKNHIKDDNRIENLQLLSCAGENSRIHYPFIKGLRKSRKYLELEKNLINEQNQPEKKESQK